MKFNAFRPIVGSASGVSRAEFAKLEEGEIGALAQSDMVEMDGTIVDAALEALIDVFSEAGRPLKLGDVIEIDHPGNFHQLRGLGFEKMTEEEEALCLFPDSGFVIETTSYMDEVSGKMSEGAKEGITAILNLLRARSKEGHEYGNTLKISVEHINGGPTWKGDTFAQDQRRVKDLSYELEAFGQIHAVAYMHEGAPRVRLAYTGESRALMNMGVEVVKMLNEAGVLDRVMALHSMMEPDSSVKVAIVGKDGEVVMSGGLAGKGGLSEMVADLLGRKHKTVDAGVVLGDALRKMLEDKLGGGEGCGNPDCKNCNPPEKRN